jgi:hypothetical protein
LSGDARPKPESTIGLGDDDMDQLLVETAGFRAMIARSAASLRTGVPVPAGELLEELRAKLPSRPEA